MRNHNHARLSGRTLNPTFVKGLHYLCYIVPCTMAALLFATEKSQIRAQINPPSISDDHLNGVRVNTGAMTIPLCG